MMRRYTLVLLLLMAVFLSAASNRAEAVPENVDSADYRIGPGDVLEISVWRNEELTKLVTVLPDGKTEFPLIGELVAEGKSVAELKREIEQKIEQFVPDPTLFVRVLEMNSMLIYVIGRVNNPGRFGLNADVNVLQALSIAGGLNPFAEGGKIKVYRESREGTEIIRFDYDEVMKGKNLAQNIKLKRGDIVVVP
ncbi:MAG: polysaccharide biosynthesis/export family protein [Desulfatiglandaceae bacterium]